MSAAGGHPHVEVKCSSVLTTVFAPSPKAFSRRLPIVPVDSSLARRPLPGAASCCAVSCRDCAMGNLVEMPDDEGSACKFRARCPCCRLLCLLCVEVQVGSSAVVPLGIAHTRQCAGIHLGSCADVPPHLAAEVVPLPSGRIPTAAS